MAADTQAALAEAMRAAREHHQAGRLAEAEQAADAALRLDPRDPAALGLLGAIAGQTGRGERAVDLLERALARAPDSANLLSNLGAALQGLGRTADALAACDRALAIQPDHVAALGNRGNALQQLGRYEEAVACYRALLRLKPDHASAPFNLGNALRAQGRLEAAIRSYRDALARQPGLAPARTALAMALNDLGTVRKDEGRTEEAAGLYREALALAPGLAATHYNLGVALKEQGARDAALAAFDEALALDPALAEARWARVMARIPVAQAADDASDAWRAAFDAGLGELEKAFQDERAADGARAVGTQQPFHLAYREEDHRDRLARYGRLCARLMGAWQRREGLPAPPATGGGRRRIGIVSGHFHDHSVWHALLEGWTRGLDAQRFELHLFHVGSARDHQTEAARRRAASFTQGLASPRAWAEAIQSKRPDVLLYPEIGLDATATKLASMRLAPVQAAAWGHPITTGLPTIDHYLSAEDFEPGDAEAHYTERLVKVPHLGCLYPPNRIEPVAPDLAALGIEDGVPLLVSPGAPFKYGPRQDALFADIARRLGACQMVFFAGGLDRQTQLLRERMRAAFVRAGVDFEAATRWIPWQPRGAFYGLMQRADAYLDTIGFSGFNTAMQGIEAGVPIVTREGRFLRGRLASGILRRMNLVDLVAPDDEAYVAQAVRLAQDRDWNGSVRGRIRAARAPLFDDAAPVRALEAYLESPGS